MDIMGLRFKIFHGSVARFMLLRALMIVGALSVAPLLRVLSGSGSGDLGLSNSGSILFPGGCLFSNLYLRPIFSSVGLLQSKEDVNMSIDVVRELMGMQMVNHEAKALFVGEGSASVIVALRDLGFSNAVGVYRHPFFSLKQKKLVYDLDYEDSSFDFVLSRGLEKVSVPAILVLEIERVLRPGGIGAMVVGISGSDPSSLIRSATPISSSLKASSIVHVGHVDEYSLVVFRKNFDNVSYFEQYHLPADCQSITNNKAYRDNIEPLVEEKLLGFEDKIVYLPKFIDVSSKKQLVYIDIGAGEHLNPNATNWFLPNYPLDHKAFNIYFVDHNTSVLLSYVKKPGITFVYHPGLVRNTNKAVAKSDPFEDLDPYMDEEGFDFLLWFKETVQYADFVVLKMNVNAAELKFLSELYETGAICFVDELFLRCSDHSDDRNVMRGSCMDLFKSLRSSGVFAHQWWGN